MVEQNQPIVDNPSEQYKMGVYNFIITWIMHEYRLQKDPEEAKKKVLLWVRQLCNDIEAQATMDDEPKDENLND